MSYGTHLIIDLYGCNQETLRDLKKVYSYLDNLPKEIQMEVLDPPKVIDYKHPNIPEDSGISGYCMITTSHCSIHTYPEREGVAFLDIFSCTHFDIVKAMDYVEKYFEPTDCDYWVIERGERFKR